jgi:hypothetical protein
MHDPLDASNDTPLLRAGGEPVPYRLNRQPKARFGQQVLGLAAVREKLIGDRRYREETPPG